MRPIFPAIIHNDPGMVFSDDLIQYLPEKTNNTVFRDILGFDYPARLDQCGGR
jgi:hypothetical protein